MPETQQDSSFLPFSRAERGSAVRLGAHWDGHGTNFAIHSVPAEKIELCLYAEDGATELARVEMADRTGDTWHVYLRDCKPGTRYGYRVHGAYQPEEGNRFNPNKLLIDPYARALDRPVIGNPSQYAYVLDAEDQDLVIDETDNGQDMPKCVVVDDRFDWGDDKRPAVPWHETIFYEVHVKGFTQQQPEIGEHVRGRYAGMASDTAVAHFKRLGVTSVELLPVHAFVDDERLVQENLSNYWGYNTIGFFAPEPRYGMEGNDPQATIDEFKGMVKALHAQGIEVILDVVYNHTAEGNHLGPTLSFKGIDHAGYYRLSPEDRRFCVDYTGTGNTLDSSSPAVLRLMMDSLRYWVEEMHVDGFRFDLASTLARGANDFDQRSAFFSVIQQDPVLAQVKLIAEPWDVGPTGYQVGGFPAPFAEWNGKYRDAVRDFWRGEDGALPEFSARICGSADVFGWSRRGPGASVNVVTVHDGFTLQDWVSYNEKHNEANHEDNRDGESHNRSWNCGAEGETDDADILVLRERQKRNMLTTLFVSQGVPLLLGGDEMSRTQGGNNNGYCQDSPISWYDWSEERGNDPLIAFVRRLTSFRKSQPVLRRTRFLSGVADDTGRRDIGWYSVWGQEMTQEEWDTPEVRLVAALLDGCRTGEVAEDGGEVMGDSVLLLINASHEDATFTVPESAAAPAAGHRASTPPRPTVSRSAPRRARTRSRWPTSRPGMRASSICCRRIP
ncbi:glycogen debranching protein GlgX [Xylophilus rhododendri]|uniref:Glycogen debranching protein GlgX n=1 Tax=Xylophilus rhododendri TaxID=2697032 RepID=A0A857J3B0_9BURK|nr:glycogen debranching protein GlgX [Xylophilus rhododendri]QHI97358.1 glycogen debranching protein GlgX [Xylophilus rhododendri]